MSINQSTGRPDSVTLDLNEKCVQAWPDRRVFTGGSVSLAAAPAVLRSADASLLPVTPYCHQGICAGDFISIRSRFAAAFSRSKQSFWKYSCWFLMTALVWVTGSKLPMWNIQSGLLWEMCFRTNISSHSSVSLWCIAAFLLVYLSTRLQDTFTSKSFGFFNWRAVSSLWTLENHFFFHTVTFVYFVCYECPTVNKLASQEKSGIENEYFSLRRHFHQISNDVRCVTAFWDWNDGEGNYISNIFGTKWPTTLSH